MSNVSAYWLSSNVISLTLQCMHLLIRITSGILLKNETAKKNQNIKLMLLVIGDLQLLLQLLKQKQLCR